MNIRGIAAITFGVALMPAVGGNSHAAEVKVFGSYAVKTVLEALGPLFEEATGNKVTFVYGSVAELKTDIEKGAAFDVAVLTAVGVADLVKQGRISASAQANLARSGVGIAIKKGAAKTDICTTDAFKHALLNAKSIGFVEQSPTGIYLKNLFPRLGIADELKSKIKFIDAKVGAGGAVASGEVEIGLTQIGEILPHAGAELLGPLPKDIQVYTNYAAGVSANSKEANAASALIKFMATPAFAKVIKEKGLEPRSDNSVN